MESGEASARLESPESSAPSGVAPSGKMRDMTIALVASKKFADAFVGVIADFSWPLPDIVKALHVGDVVTI